MWPSLMPVGLRRNGERQSDRDGGLGEGGGCRDLDVVGAGHGRGWLASAASAGGVEHRKSDDGCEQGWQTHPVASAQGQRKQQCEWRQGEGAEGKCDSWVELL
jgi:hypothetical protein